MEIADGANRQSSILLDTKDQERQSEWAWYHLLPIATIVIYMFTPVLSWQLGLPSLGKFIGHLLVLVMIGLAFVRMIVIDKIPGAFLVIIALTIIGSLRATFEWQNPAVTINGWWMMFRYPMVGLYVYLAPYWPRSIARWLPKVLVWVLGIQVVGQIALYISGVREFDHLSGTFGRFGVGPLVYFLILVLSFALGNWLVTGDWKLLIITLALGSFASGMGEMKLFVIAAPLLAGIILGIHILQGGKAKQLFLYIGFFMIAGTGFYFAYETFIVDRVGVAPLERFLESDQRDNYLGHIREINYSWQLGRNAEVEYGWQLIQKDVPSLLFGYGLGTRQYSAEFNLVGIGVSQSLYGNYVGRSLLSIMYEMGMLGLTTLVLFSVYIVVTLYRAAKRDPDPDLDVLRYGILLFTALWPLWIWYKPVWILTAPTLLYWCILGYIMRYSFDHPFSKNSSIPSSNLQEST